MEKYLIELFSGQMGGVVAFSFGAGVVMSWNFFKRHFVKDYQTNLSELRDEMTKRDQRCETRIEVLNQRIKDLESMIMMLSSKPRKPFIVSKEKDDA